MKWIPLAILLTPFITGCNDDSDPIGSETLKQTTDARVTMNLDPAVTPPAERFDPEKADSFNQSTTQTVYDSLFLPHDLQLYFAKADHPGSPANAWWMYVRIDGQKVGDPVNDAPTEQAFILTFNNDGDFSRTLSDTPVITNWLPIDENGEPNGASGPINVADGGSNLPIVLPPTSSNFTITVEDLTQRASATTRTVKVTPHIELDHSVGELEKAFNQTDSTTYHARITHSIYDSLGIKHLLELYFIKASNSTPPQWQMIAKVNGKDIGDPAPGNSTTSDAATVARYNLQFDQNGQVDTAQSDPGLVSNWHPLLESGEPTGADLPVNKIDGATLPIPEPPDSSNFEIDYSSLKLNFKQR